MDGFFRSPCSHWWLCLLCLSIVGGYGDSFLYAFQVYLLHNHAKGEDLCQPQKTSAENVERNILHKIDSATVQGKGKLFIRKLTPTYIPTCPKTGY